MNVFMTFCTIAAVLLLLSSANAATHTFYIDSFNEGFAWNDDIAEAIQKTLQGHDVNLKIHHMNTTRNPDENFRIRAARIATSVIDKYRPDIVIASDDNASKYLIMPYYKNGSLPFLFCGANYSADAYRFPNGTPVDDIPIVRSTQADIILNMRVANKLGLKMSKSFRKIASID